MRQCPRCELRFATQADVRDHLSRDHAVADERLDHLLPAAGRSGRRDPGEEHTGPPLEALGAETDEEPSAG